jgi:2-dehydropantoate 2-reductase
MRICVVGAGAVGASIGGRLAAAGEEVTLVDVRDDHVAAIEQYGLKAAGVPRPVEVRTPACHPSDLKGPFHLALIATDANHTAEAAATAARVLAPQGFALTVQNGIGNVETLVAELGPGRVIGGSTMCSFRVVAPGHVEQTHMGPTTIGELDGSESARTALLKEKLERAGYPVVVTPDIMAVIWTKFVVNVSINPICAVTGLRLGEFARCEATDHFQDRILDEAFEVIRAKGIELPEAELRAQIKTHCFLKFSQPSMLQHMEAGRRTEIDALNGALVREARAMGMQVPYNESLTALVKGRERAEMRNHAAQTPDWEALEAEARRAFNGKA